MELKLKWFKFIGFLSLGILCGEAFMADTLYTAALAHVYVATVAIEK